MASDDLTDSLCHGGLGLAVLANLRVQRDHNLTHKPDESRWFGIFGSAGFRRRNLPTCLLKYTYYLQNQTLKQSGLFNFFRVHLLMKYSKYLNFSV